MKSEDINGATPIDADEAEGLIPNLTTQKELNAWEQTNIADAALEHYGKKYTFAKILDYIFLKQLHKNMFSKTWKWAGEYRKTEKNFVSSAPEKIAIDLNKLIGDVLYWISNQTYLPDEICSRFHHRLVAIHLFPNGNGRHARFAADLLSESFGNEPFSWGSSDLYIAGEARTKYLESLREADNNNYEPLIKFVRS